MAVDLCKVSRFPHTVYVLYYRKTDSLGRKHAGSDLLEVQVASVQEEKDTVTEEVGRQIKELSLKSSELEEQNRVLKIIKVREEEIARLNAVVVELMEKKNQEMEAHEEVARLNMVVVELMENKNQEMEINKAHEEEIARLNAVVAELMELEKGRVLEISKANEDVFRLRTIVDGMESDIKELRECNDRMMKSNRLLEDKVTVAMRQNEKLSLDVTELQETKTELVNTTEIQRKELETLASYRVEKDETLEGDRAVSSADTGRMAQLNLVVSEVCELQHVDKGREHASLEIQELPHAGIRKAPETAKQVRLQ